MWKGKRLWFWFVQLLVPSTSCVLIKFVLSWYHRYGWLGVKCPVNTSLWLYHQQSRNKRLPLPAARRAALLSQCQKARDVWPHLPAISGLSTVVATILDHDSSETEAAHSMIHHPWRSIISWEINTTELATVPRARFLQRLCKRCGFLRDGAP